MYLITNPFIIAQYYFSQKLCNLFKNLYMFYFQLKSTNERVILLIILWYKKQDIIAYFTVFILTPLDA